MVPDSGKRIVRTICSACYCGCGVYAHVEDGEVIKIEGDPDHPNNRGELCPKGKAGLELLYHPGRLNHPLRRAGKRGEGKWERISWNEALDAIAQKLKSIKEEDGPESICITTGSALSYNMGIMGYFAYLLGTPNLSCAGNICFLPAAIACQASTGYAVSAFANEIVSDEPLNSRCILLWGSNPRNSFCYPLGEGIFRVKEQGTKLIVVDSRPTDYARIADIWLQVRPATDDALALGMINVLINEGLYDKEFIATWTYGFDELKRHVQGYTPERVSEITWIPRENIVAAARMFAQTRPSAICQRVAVDQNLNAVQTSRAILILRAMCGKDFDRQGGNLLPADKPIIGEFPHFAKTRQLPQEVKERLIGAEALPLASGPDAAYGFVHPSLLAKAIATGEPYKVRALISSGHNQLMSDPDTDLILQGLRNLDLSVTLDLFMTPSCEQQDFVLPAACWLERNGLRGHPAYPYVTPISHRAIEPLHERWDDIKFFIELAKRMGLNPPWQSVEDYYNERLAPAKVTFKELEDKNYIPKPKEYGRLEKGSFEFKTPSKKLEIYSTFMEKHGYDPLPSHKPPPETTAEFPFVLIGGRKKLGYLHSTGRQIASLRKLAPDPTIEMSPETAKSLGISDGDWVGVETVYFNDRKRAKFRAKLVDGFLPQVVAVDAQWWFPERDDPGHGFLESNINVVIAGDVYDPVFGSTNIRSIPCRIYRIEKRL